MISNDLFLPFNTAYDGPALTPQMLDDFSAKIPYRLPASYIQVLYVKNGGFLNRTQFDIVMEGDQSRTFTVPLLMGIGGTESIDSPRGIYTLSEFLIREWNFPDCGVVFSFAGHSGYIFDYRERGPSDEPTVIYSNSENWPTVVTYPVADNFQEFLDGLYVAP